MRHLIVAAMIAAGVFSAGPAQAQQGPPPEALAACRTAHQGAACSFRAPRGMVTGICGTPPRAGALVCMPAGGGPRMGQGPGQGQGLQGQGLQGQGLQGQGLGQGPGQGQGYGQGPGQDAAATGFRPKPGYTPNAAPSDVIVSASRLRDTGQVTCFDARTVIPCPAPGAAFFGQDAQVESRVPAYRIPGDGTVFDPATGLSWQQGHDGRRLSFADARSACQGLTLGGRADWRLPTIKELFSISHWQGVTGQRPFLDSAVFEIAPPSESQMANDPVSTHSPEMMGQTWSSTIYQGQHWDRAGVQAAFFFNALDGRIKQAPTQGRMGLFTRCVAGPVWGANQFRDNGDGTVFDGLSGLTWQQADDGMTRDWPAALAYCDGLTLAGHTDWRLPNVKELQSIVDYSRPQPAIDTGVFRQADPAAWFWSSTTHGDQPDHAAYVCFGRCTSTEDVDVHGAGAQRSDPKTGDPTNIGPRGGQRDATRIRNAVRCVRG